MTRGCVLKRWFAEPQNILDALDEAYEVEVIETPDSNTGELSPTEVVFLRNDQLWRVHHSWGDDLTDTTQIEVYVVDPTVEFDNADEKEAWEDELGENFHEELLNLLGAPAVPVICDDCSYSFVAVDHEEAEEAKTIHQENAGNSGHTVSIGG